MHSGLVSGQVSILCSEDHGTDYDSMWSLVSVGDNSSNQPEEYGVSRLDGRVWSCDAIDDVQVKFDKIIFLFRTVINIILFLTRNVFFILLNF